MANNGSKDIQGELLHNVGLTPDDQTGMCNGNGSIEHRIIKDETSSYCSEESVDSPLDFSFKRRHCEIEASSTGSPNSPGSTQGGSGSYGEDKKFSDNEDGSSFNGNSYHNNHKRDYENRMPSSNQTFNPGIASVVQAIQSGAIPSVAAASMCGTFPSIAALMDPRIASQASNKPSRPFKAYPKEPLSVPFGCFGMNPYQTIESSMLQGLNLSSEDIMQLYKHQLRSLQEQQSESHRSLMKPSTLSSASATSSHTGTSASYNPQHHSAPNTPTSSSFNRAQTPSIPSTSSGQASTHSSSRRRARTFPDEQKDEAYWERRRKNNEAAKRSRDARRAKEDEIAIRAALLEQENMKLRVEVAALKTETAKLRCMLYNT